MTMLDARKNIDALKLKAEQMGGQLKIGLSTNDFNGMEAAYSNAWDRYFMRHLDRLREKMKRVPAETVDYLTENEKAPQQILDAIEKVERAINKTIERRKSA